MTREEAKAWLNKLYARADITDEYGDMEDMHPYEEAVNMAIKALEQEPCDNLISRQAVLNTLDRMDKALDTDRTVESYKELLTECYKDLPSVKQEPKTGQGKWIEERTYMECPNCHDIWHYEENQTERFKCCPTCGERNEYESKYTRNRI